MKNFLTSLFLGLVLLTGQSQALTLTALNNAQFDLDRASPGAMAKYRLGDKVLKGQTLDLKAQYNFATQGGAIGVIPLLDPLTGFQATLPQNAIVVGCVIDVLTTPTSSGSSTVAIGTGQAANDLKAALAFGSYTGLVACIPVGTAATDIKLTADRSMTITIATAALTNGKFNVHVQYVISE